VTSTKSSYPWWKKSRILSFPPCFWFFTVIQQCNSLCVASFAGSDLGHLGVQLIKRMGHTDIPSEKPSSCTDKHDYTHFTPEIQYFYPMFIGTTGGSRQKNVAKEVFWRCSAGDRSNHSMVMSKGCNITCKWFGDDHTPMFGVLQASYTLAPLCWPTSMWLSLKCGAAISGNTQKMDENCSFFPLKHICFQWWWRSRALGNTHLNAFILNIVPWMHVSWLHSPSFVSCLVGSQPPKRQRISCKYCPHWIITVENQEDPPSLKFKWMVYLV